MAGTKALERKYIDHKGSIERMSLHLQISISPCGNSGRETSFIPQLENVPYR
jgi:hypothetical protein